MFGPELHAANDSSKIRLAPIEYDDLPEQVDPRITEYLTDYFKKFVTELPMHYEWLAGGSDNLHWGIYSPDKSRLFGITGIRNVEDANSPAISRITLFNHDHRGQGVGGLAYAAQYGYLRHAGVADHFEHAADNENVGSLRIAARVGFVAVHDDGVRTTMHLKLGQ